MMKKIYTTLIAAVLLLGFSCNGLLGNMGMGDETGNGSLGNVLGAEFVVQPSCF